MNLADIPTYVNRVKNSSDVVYKISDLVNYTSKYHEIGDSTCKNYLLIKEESCFTEFLYFEDAYTSDGEHFISLEEEFAYFHVDGVSKVRHAHFREKGYIFYLDVPNLIQVLKIMEGYMEEKGREFEPEY